jgi:UDP-N-acetylglucosamine 4,6-dehydratase/5-epimerase
MSYLIFGGTGSLGKKLIERLLPTNKVAVYSRDEAKHWTIRNELATHENIQNLHFCVGDIRDKERIKDILRQVKPKNIIIAAALKQVDTCELSPSESVQTNINGTQNVIDAVNSLAQNQLETVCFVSTDKACSPVNTYGMCKAVSERIVTSQASTGLSHVNYVAVRYGNVLESRGSIIPLFKYQAENSSHLTVTDPTMTRFVMTLNDSVNLILKAVTYGDNGTTWIPLLPSMLVGDIAKIFAENANKPIKVIGLRPGEKMHEDLINESESSRTIYSKEHNCYVINPAYNPGNNKTFTYTSNDNVLTFDELKQLLKKLGIIDKRISDFVGLSIEEILTNKV